VPAASLPPALAARIAALRERSERDRTGAYVLEGPRAFAQACAAGVGLEAVVHAPVLLRCSTVEKLVRLRRREGVPVVRVRPEAFRRVSTTARASGLLAVARQRWTSLDRLDPARGLCWLALERIRSPGNLGTILRTAEAVGAAGLVCLGPAVDPFDPTAVRASMGALFHLELARTAKRTFGRWARERGVQVLGTSPGARRDHTEVPLRRPLAVLLGEERRGLTRTARRACSEVLRLPIAGRADSLNVAVAGGVVLYEVLRRAGGAHGRGASG